MEWNYIPVNNFSGMSEWVLPGLNPSTKDRTRLDRIRLNWIGLDRTGLDWNGLDWNAFVMQCNGICHELLN